ncbi:hypothetical protein OOJ91_13950 [Micromonospora lupini]|uniref:hypothetical protein n=1 Tax=Micromonospora lupini TaxID=285679 RepID=UPI002255C2A6|nr:hypothetical protein [Micromonospora lupini]MCX5066951.1 hypothetical protein [Micromonospora lupini]
MSLNTESAFARAVLAADKRRRRNRRDKVITHLITSVLLSLLGGWALMLAVGIARAEWLPALPTIGYWPAVLLSALLRSALTNPASTKES